MAELGARLLKGTDFAFSHGVYETVSWSLSLLDI